MFDMPGLDTSSTALSLYGIVSNDLVSASSLSLFKLRLHKFDLHTVASLVF